VLRAQVKAGFDALDRGDFVEVDDVDLDGYLEGLTSSPGKHPADAHGALSPVAVGTRRHCANPGDEPTTMGARTALSSGNIATWAT
jgi:hypothetical protein